PHAANAAAPGRCHGLARDLTPHPCLPVRIIGRHRADQREGAHELLARRVLASAVSTAVAMRIGLSALDEHDAFAPVTFAGHGTPPALSFRSTHLRSTGNARATRCCTVPTRTPTSTATSLYDSSC